MSESVQALAVRRRLADKSSHFADHHRGVRNDFGRRESEDAVSERGQRAIASTIIHEGRRIGVIGTAIYLQDDRIRGHNVHGADAVKPDLGPYAVARA